MTPLDLAREYFPDWDDDFLDYVLWNETAYPFNVRGDGVEDALRLQLAQCAARELHGFYGYRCADWHSEHAMAMEAQGHQPQTEPAAIQATHRR